jgi:hypothetical protein
MMDSNWRQILSRFLTLAYLLSAAAITVATSKASDGPVGPVNWGLSGVTNYSVRSNCSTLAYNVDAIRVENGVIRQSLDSDGVVRATTITDFTQLGFVQSSTIIGVDQYGSSPTNPTPGSTTNSESKCLVRSRQSTVNSYYDASQSNYSYLQPGSLTTVQYDCYNATAYQCSITLGELRAGEGHVPVTVRV